MSHHLRLSAVALGATILLTGCGGGAGPAPAGGGTTTASTGTAGHLTIVVHPGFVLNGKDRTWALDCGPAGGTVPRPGQACARLEGTPALLAPTDACGPAVGDTGSEQVSGTWNGKAVALTFSGNCNGDRWGTLAAALEIDSSAPADALGGGATTG